MRIEKIFMALLIFAFVAPFFSAGRFFHYADAFESSSSGFEIHASSVESVSGSGSSAGFQGRSAGGQNATGESAGNTKIIISGILDWLYETFKPQYEQAHFRWRNDDGSESSATWIAAEDTQLSGAATSTNYRVRFLVSNEGWTRSESVSYRLEFAQTSACSGGSYSAVPTSEGSSHWVISDSVYIGDGNPTTNVSGGLTDENPAFDAGQIKDAGNTASGISLTSEEFTEIEFSVRATSNAVAGETYCFRLTNAGSATNFIYTAYPKATIVVPPTFEIPVSHVGTIAGEGASANFKTRSAGGQNATGESAVSAKKVLSGILYWLFEYFKPQYTQVHFRWRNDDGSEIAATWGAAEDTATTSVDKLIVKRVRFEISNEGWTKGSSQQFRIEYAQASDCASGSYLAVPTDASLHWQIADSVNVSDGESTTNVSGGLTDENPAFKTGQVKDAGNTTANISVTSQDFTEVEYGIKATANAVDGATYCFRLTNAGSTANYVYNQYAKATLSGAPSGFPATGNVESPTFDTYTVNGANFNWIKWKGTVPGGTRVRLQFAASNSSGGPFTFAGPDCTSNTWFEPASDTSAEVKCQSTHNNKRYFRYKVQLCSNSDCATSGSQTPEVQDVIVNWSP